MKGLARQGNGRTCFRLFCLSRIEGSSPLTTGVKNWLIVLTAPLMEILTPLCLDSYVKLVFRSLS
jgi:hypothetical protein